MWTCRESPGASKHREAQAALANPELILEGQQGSGFYSQRPKAQEEICLWEFLTERH